MDAKKITEKKASKLPALLYCLVLASASGIIIGVALNNLQLSLGISFGLAAIVSAIFLSQDNL
jgi:uncharacterized membrane protein YedE/YeeE